VLVTRPRRADIRVHGDKEGKNKKNRVSKFRAFNSYPILMIFKIKAYSILRKVL